MIKKDDYELYFLNDSYDDELISDTIASFRNRLYYDILDGKKYIQNNLLKNGDLDNIVINKSLNRKFGMPEDTYSLHLNFPVMPFYSKQEFITNYDFDKPIPMSKIMTDNETFTKNILFYIGDYFIFNIHVVLERNTEHSIIFIPTGIEYGIDRDFLYDLINTDDNDNLWSIYLSERSDSYYNYASRSSLIDGNKIRLDNLQQFSMFNKPNEANSWTICVTYNNSSPDIMISSYCTLESDSNGKYFLIPDEFRDFMYSNATTLKCLIFNNPTCLGNGIYINTDSTYPIFRIPYKKNPIPLDNIIVWKYDSVNKRKLHPLEICATLDYPNIYNFSDMIDDGYFQLLIVKSKSFVILSSDEILILGKTPDGSKVYDLYIEWNEPIEDISAFDTYIDDYINCYDEDYVSMHESGTLHPKVESYTPISKIDFTPKDYFNSEFKGDYRAWRMDKIIKLLKDNPKRYEELYNKIYQKIKKVISKSYTYESNPHIYERSLTNNKCHCNNSNERYTKFNEPTTFIKVYNASCSKRGCNLYIDGVLKDITTVMSFGSTLYVYFPAAYLINKEDIHLDIYLDDMEIELYHTWLSMTKDSYDIEHHPFLFKNSISNMIFTEDKSGKYLTSDDLSLELQIAIADIQYIGLDKVDTISMISTETELYENELKLFVPTDYDAVILKITEILHSIENMDSQKKIDLNNIQISVKNKNLYNKVLGIYTSNFRKVNYFYANDTDTLILSDYCGKPDKSRFNIFIDGLLLNPDSYTIEFTTYKGFLTIMFNNTIPNGHVMVEYISFDRDIIYTGRYGDLNDTNDDILYLDDILDTPFDNLIYQIYIDGYRIHHNDIKFISQNSMIKINPKRDIINDSEVVILKQRIDPTPYDYETNLEFLSDVAKDDIIFRKYILDKYN